MNTAKYSVINKIGVVLESLHVQELARIEGTQSFPMSERPRFTKEELGYVESLNPRLARELGGAHIRSAVRRYAHVFLADAIRAESVVELMLLGVDRCGKEPEDRLEEERALKIRQCGKLAEMANAHALETGDPIVEAGVDQTMTTAALVRRWTELDALERGLRARAAAMPMKPKPKPHMPEPRRPRRETKPVVRTKFEDRVAEIVEDAAARATSSASVVEAKAEKPAKPTARERKHAALLSTEEIARLTGTAHVPAPVAESKPVREPRVTRDQKRAMKAMKALAIAFAAIGDHFRKEEERLAQEEAVLASLSEGDREMLNLLVIQEGRPAAELIAELGLAPKAA